MPRRLPRMAGCAPAILRSSTTASSTSRDARRKSSSSTARTTTRTTSKPCCRPSRDSNWARSRRRGARAPAAPTDELVLFVLHRKDMADFLPLATRAMHLVNEHAGVEVARVVPVQRIPKTTSGKLQRTALARSYENGEFARRDRGVRSRLGRSARPWPRRQGPDRAAAQGHRRRRDAGQARRRRRQPVRRRRQFADADPDPRKDRRALPGRRRPDRAVRFPDDLAARRKHLGDEARDGCA